MLLTAGVVTLIALGPLAVGFVLGVFTGDVHRHRECLNCKRRITHSGFSVDGEDYEVARRIVRGAELLGRTGR